LVFERRALANHAGVFAQDFSSARVGHIKTPGEF
jgi:hypothetical protein